MDFLKVWLMVLLGDLLIWASVTRILFLHRIIDRICWKKLKNVPNSVSPSKAGAGSRPLVKAREYLDKLFLVEDERMSGFLAPKVTRTLIAAAIVAQNCVAITHGYMASTGAVRLEALSIRSGELALANMLPLMFCVTHERLIVGIPRQGSAQVGWAHTLFAWIIWYEIVLHSTASITASSGLVSWSRLIPPAMGFLTSVFFCFNLNPGQYGTDREQGAKLRGLTHIILGIFCVLGCICHSIKSLTATSISLGSLALAIGGAESFRAYKKTNLRSTETLFKNWRQLRIRVPAAQADFYFKFADGIRRPAWIEKDVASESYEAVVFIPYTKGAKQTVDYKGPFKIPLSPYVRHPRSLSIIVARSSITEGYSCFRWRRLFLDAKTTTTLTWLANDPHQALLFLRQFQWDGVWVKVMAYGPEMTKAKEEMTKAKKEEMLWDMLFEYPGIKYSSSDSTADVLREFPDVWFQPGQTYVAGEELRGSVPKLTYVDLRSVNSTAL